MAQDPLRQIMSMADDARKQVDSLISQGTRQIKTTLPQLPFPGDGTPELPKGPQELLAKLPKLPEIPGLPTPELPAAKKRAAATSKFLSTGPRLQVHPKEWHNSHTLSPAEIVSLRGALQKNGVPTSSIRPRVLSK